MWNRKTKIVMIGAVFIVTAIVLYGLLSRKHTPWPAKADEETIKVSETIKKRVSAAQNTNLEIVDSTSVTTRGGKFSGAKANGAMEVALDRSDKPLPKGADSKSKVKGPPDISLDEKGNPLIDDKGNPLPVKK